jgi:hypothetical protein
MQDGRLRLCPGNHRRRGLVSPLSRQRDRPLLFIEEGEDFPTSRLAHFEDQEPFSPQRVKRVRDRCPS